MRSGGGGSLVESSRLRPSGLSPKGAVSLSRRIPPSQKGRTVLSNPLASQEGKRTYQIFPRVGDHSLILCTFIAGCLKKAPSAWAVASALLSTSEGIAPTRGISP